MRAWDEDLRDSLDAGDSVGYHALLHLSQGQVCTLVKSLGTPARHSSQQGLRCGSICPVTTGQESVVNRCATSPHSVQISHPRRQGPSTQETILSDHPQQCTVLPRCCLSRSPWRLAWHQRSIGSMPFEYAVDGSTSQTHTGSNSTLLNALTGKCKHLMPNTHRGWTGHCLNNQKNFWKNMQILIQSCHSVKIDLGERPPIQWFRSSTIPLDLALNVCPR